MEKPRKILITGGLGFIFSHVAEYFAAKGWEVHVIDNESAGSNKELPETKEWKDLKIRLYTMDVSFQSVIPVIEAINPDYIIHGAAISDVDYSIRHPAKVIAANNNATMNVFEAARNCKNLKKLLYVSTDEVYGECEHKKREDEIIFPRNPYSLSKAFGSLLRLAYDNTFPELRNKTVETRFCNVFGPRQDARKILPAIRKAMDKGSVLTIHNDGAGYREFIYVKEIAPALELLLEKGDRTYNITLNYGKTVKELVQMASNLSPKLLTVKFGKRSGMDLKYQMDGERLRALGWKPQFDPETALSAYLTGNPL